MSVTQYANRGRAAESGRNCVQCRFARQTRYIEQSTGREVSPRESVCTHPALTVRRRLGRWMSELRVIRCPDWCPLASIGAETEPRQEVLL